MVMRILVVEDEKRLAQTLRDLLHREGYTVDVCYSGTEGLDNALSGIYDLMLLDVMLPGLDGFTVLERLRGSGSRLPVLMLTARGELSDRVHGLDRGADYYLTSPFRVRSCWPACVSCCGGRPGRPRWTTPFAGATCSCSPAPFRCAARSAAPG